MFSWFLFVFCTLGTIYGAWSIPRDLARGYVRGRGFGFDRATQPVGYFALMAFNCVVVVILLTVALILGINLLRHALTG
jgi:hypothetical protein